MRTTLRVVSVFLAVVLSSCGRSGDVHWKDGNFEVYTLDLNFSATKLGYNHHPGILGLVDEEVIAAGSNSELVFVERLNPKSKRNEFYIVPKEHSTNSHSGTVDGPYTQEQFEEIRTARQLPPFVWHKKEG